jgi:hypothetical protein
MLRARVGGASGDDVLEPAACDDSGAAAPLVSVSRRSRSVGLRECALLSLAAMLVVLGFWGGELVVQPLVEREAIGAEAPRGAVSHALRDAGDAGEDAAAEALAYPQLLHEYYRKHNPKLLGDVPALLSRYAGRESELFAKLERKYGAKVVSSSGQARVVNEAAASSAREGEHQDELLQSADRQAMEEEDSESASAADEDEQAGFAAEEPALAVARGSAGSRRDSSESWDSVVERFEESGEAAAWAGGAAGPQGEAARAVLGDAARGGSWASPSSPGASKTITIVVGFPGTGVEEVRRYLGGTLGLRVQPAQETCALLLRASGAALVPELNLFDAWDALADDSTAVFYPELLATYPRAHVIVLVRDVEEWVRDWRVGSWRPSDATLYAPVLDSLLGGAQSELMLRKRYWLFYERLLAHVARERRKLMVVPAARDSENAHAHAHAHAQAQRAWDYLRAFLIHRRVVLREAVPLGTGGAARQSSLPVPMLEPDAMSRLHESEILAWPGGSGEPALPALELLVVGLDGSGTEAIAEALRRLGLTVASKWWDRANNKHAAALWSGVIDSAAPPARAAWAAALGGVQALVGTPADTFLAEMVQGKGEVRVVFAARNLDAWASHVRCKWSKWSANPHQHRMLQHQFGTVAKPSAWMLKSKYAQHLALLQTVPTSRVLVLDVEAQDSHTLWTSLCHFSNARCSPKTAAAPFPRISKCQ